MRIRLGRKVLAGLASLCLSSSLFTGCAPTGEGEDLVEPHNSGSTDGKGDSSVEATFLNFEFDGELTTARDWNPEGEINDQLLYTIGHLNGDRSVGRLDNLELSNIHSEAGNTIRYHAKLPVAWGKPSQIPAKYSLTLPRDMDGLSSFTDKYKHDCAEVGAHDVNRDSMWYYFRPNQSGCKLDDADVVHTEATVTLSKNITTDKYPEYDKVWADNELRVVAIFGKYESGAVASFDAGISAYNEFVRAIRTALGSGVTTTPAEVSQSPGVEQPDVTFEAKLADGKKVVVNVLLVDEIAAAGEAFYDRYESLSARADLIAYNGHAGLGQNVRALARRGKFVSGQYVIVFMNGCDTYAYVDGSLAEARRSLNPDDPTGTKYLDFVVNAMPAFFSSDSEASMALINGLLSYKAPQKYRQIFERIDRSQVVMVTGEEDNTFTPSTAPDPGLALDELGTVKRNESRAYKTATLPAGTYVVQITGTGDADLYVRKGADPTTRIYDCRPYKNGSEERCEVQLSSPNTLNIMVRGYGTSSDYHLTGVKK